MGEPSPTTSHAGRVLGGKYRLLEPLGRGGMGTVWKADHLTLKSPVAVKVVEPQSGSDDEASFRRLAREAQAAAALRSPHVVQVLDHGMDGGSYYIVMELLEGETLRERLNRDRTLAPETVYRLLVHLGRALSRAHDAGVVHRDLKPENIFLVKNHDEEIAKVLDFGVAKRVSAQPDTLGGDGTQSGVMMGTPSYMSPEQAWGTRAVDARADLWAMGVIACECLSGARVFRGGALGELVIQICTEPLPRPSERAPVPAGFDAWFFKALAREPSERFQSAQALVDAAQPILSAASAGASGVVFRPGDAPLKSPEPRSELAETIHEVVSAPIADTPPSRSKGRRIWIALAVVGLGAAALAALVHRGVTPPGAPSFAPPSPSAVVAPAASVDPPVATAASATAIASASAPASDEAGPSRSSGAAHVRKDAANAPRKSPEHAGSTPAPTASAKRPRVDLGI